MTVSSMLVVCDLDGGCTARDGTLQPKGTAFDRVVTDGVSYNPGPGLKLMSDDGRALYVQNSNAQHLPIKMLPQYSNDTAARAGGLNIGDFYINLAGIQQVQATGN